MVVNRGKHEDTDLQIDGRQIKRVDQFLNILDAKLQDSVV